MSLGRGIVRKMGRSYQGHPSRGLRQILSGPSRFLWAAAEGSGNSEDSPRVQHLAARPAPLRIKPSTT